jgi:xanthine dehydrogenase accessory factor
MVQQALALPGGSATDRVEDAGWDQPGTDILELVRAMRHAGRAFALATVVRTVASTACKPGAKAVIMENGEIEAGWIGGGCARGAVIRAACAALADGQPRLISIQPKDLLGDLGITPGEGRDGVEFFANGCPSRGTVDIFVEPMLPRPRLLICGASPVAISLASLARRFGFSLTVAAPAAGQSGFAHADRRLDGYANPDDAGPAAYAIVATQGANDAAALAYALRSGAPYVAFVGSTKKIAALRDKLSREGLPPDRLAQLRGPAGLDIGAITPDEIALSILADMIRDRRKAQRVTTP